MPNKAKFQNAKNEYNPLFHNDYQQQTTNNKLLKTKPNKANLRGKDRCAHHKRKRSRPPPERLRDIEQNRKVYKKPILKISNRAGSASSFA
jgi:hypothetical protein